MSQSFTFDGTTYPLFTKEGEEGSLKHVKDVALKCLVCPEGPLFTDLPHLVIHYAGKDHLKKANEIHVRHDLGFDESVRLWKLYQLWEKKNQLWRLLIETHQRKQQKTSHKFNSSKISKKRNRGIQHIQLDDQGPQNVDALRKAAAQSEEANATAASHAQSLLGTLSPSLPVHETLGTRFDEQTTANYGNTEQNYYDYPEPQNDEQYDTYRDSQYQYQTTAPMPFLPIDANPYYHHQQPIQQFGQPHYPELEVLKIESARNGKTERGRKASPSSNATTGQSKTEQAGQHAYPGMGIFDMNMEKVDTLAQSKADVPSIQPIKPSKRNNQPKTTTTSKFVVYRDPVPEDDDIDNDLKIDDTSTYSRPPPPSVSKKYYKKAKALAPTFPNFSTAKKNKSRTSTEAKFDKENVYGMEGDQDEARFLTNVHKKTDMGRCWSMEQFRPVSHDGFAEDIARSEWQDGRILRR